MSSAPSLLTREEGTSSIASSRARRLPRLRPSTSHILVAGSVILAFVFNLLALQEGRGATELVAVADAPIEAGTLLSDAPIRWVPISNEFDALHSMVTKPDLAATPNLRFARSVSEGTAIVGSTVTSDGNGDGLRIMSVPIEVGHSAGTALLTGDRVDAISVVDGEAAFIALDLEVVGISADDAGGLSIGGPRYVLLATTAEDALTLAHALDAGSLELIRSTGAVPVGDPSR